MVHPDDSCRHGRSPVSAYPSLRWLWGQAGCARPSLPPFHRVVL